MEARKISDSQVVMTEMVLPSHTNSLGSIFGGTVMSWIDIAAAICAQRHSRKSVVTAHIDDLQFVAPVHLGWVVNLKASVNYVGSTSMEIGVRVDAENPLTGARFHTASAYLTFVAVDTEGRPSKIPGLILETQDDHRRNKMAQQRRDNRLRKRQTVVK